jgi:hypothetical protein
VSALHEALAQYVEIRRALGTKLTEPAATLAQFVAFLERERATHIITSLAVPSSTWNGIAAIRRAPATSAWRRCTPSFGMARSKSQHGACTASACSRYHRSGANADRWRFSPRRR